MITADEAESLAHDERKIAERVYGLGNLRKARELGNKEADDGFRYRGCGLMQTTGRANFRRMGQLCGVDFEQNPDWVFSAEHALKPALAEWSEAGLNVYADNNDLLAISRAINCGSPKSKTIPNGLQDRAIWFAKVRRLIDRVEFKIETTTATEAIKTPDKPAEFAITDLVGEQVFGMGDEGPIVRAVQLALARLGYPLRGTGNFGGATHNAITDFQRKYGLEVDGELGPDTAKAIDRALTDQPPDATPPVSAPAIADLIGGRILRAGHTGPIVQAVQLGLARLGYPLTGTANFGPNTEKAVRDFQQKNKLEVDGEVGPEFARAIDRALAAHAQTSAPSLKVGEKPPASSGEKPTPAGATGVLTEVVGNRILVLGDEGAAVETVQQALAKLGYPVKATGYYGGDAEAAVIDFQQRRGIEVDGEVGAETAGELERALAGQPPSERPKGEELTPSAGTDARPLWVTEGLKWLDHREVIGGADNPEILEWAREEGGDIATVYKHDDTPWCALYANMVLTKVGIKGTETLWALDWNDWGQKLKGPAVGAFAPMKRSAGGHIAIVVGRDRRGNLMCLGGNQDDAVNIKPFPANRPLSFRWPIGVSLPDKIGVDSLPLLRSDGRISIKES